MLHTIAKSPVFTMAVIIANFCGMIFLKWIIPDEYYLFSSDRYALEAAWLLLWQQMT